MTPASVQHFIYLVKPTADVCVPQGQPGPSGEPGAPVSKITVTLEMYILLIRHVFFLDNPALETI